MSTDHTQTATAARAAAALHTVTDQADTISKLLPQLIAEAEAAGLPDLLDIRIRVATGHTPQIDLQARCVADVRTWAAVLQVELSVQDTRYGPQEHARHTSGAFTRDGVSVTLSDYTPYTAAEWAALRQAEIEQQLAELRAHAVQHLAERGQTPSPAHWDQWHEWLDIDPDLRGRDYTGQAVSA